MDGIDGRCGVLSCRCEPQCRCRHNPVRRLCPRCDPGSSKDTLRSLLRLPQLLPFLVASLQPSSGLILRRQHVWPDLIAIRQRIRTVKQRHNRHYLTQSFFIQTQFPDCGGMRVNTIRAAVCGLPSGKFVLFDPASHRFDCVVGIWRTVWLATSVGNGFDRLRRRSRQRRRRVVTRSFSVQYGHTTA